MIFSFDKSASLDGGQKKTPELIRRASKNERKNKEIIIAHHLDKL